MRLQAFMTLKGINGRQLSEMTGIGRSSISRYLKGEYQPRFEEISIIADALEIDPRDFFMDENYININNIPKEILFKETIALLQRECVKISKGK